ncbi:MAG TPA: chromate transporter [Clostridiales bacterium]|nr:chromate transporter [Clostridiales bacterium]
MIYLTLFLVFLEIGAVSFGGGYGMIPMMRDACLSHGFLTEEQFMDFIAVAESTPGPIAVNMATFVGSSQGGFLGALLATLGVILPALLIILLIAAVLKNLLKYKGVQGFLSGVRPAVAALILATAVTMGLRTIFGVTSVSGGFAFNYKGLIILAILVAVGLGSKYLLKKKASPIVVILISAGLGVLLYGVF